MRIGSTGKHRQRGFMWWLSALAIVLVGAATTALYILEPSGGSVAATPATTAAPQATPPPTEPMPPATPANPVSPAPVTTSQPSPTFPADQVDTSWPKNPPWDACPAPVWPGAPSDGTPGNGRRVLILGDSLTRESQEAMTRFLEEAGWTPTFRCWGSKRLDWGLDQIKQAKKSKQLPEYVIVALGTNDVSWEQPDTTQRRVNTMLDRIGDEREVLWVDLDIAYSDFSMRRADWFNGMIRQVAKERPNVKVVPWEKIAREEDALRFDGIHYGTSGYKLRARALTDALNDRARAVDPAAALAPSPSPTP